MEIPKIIDDKYVEEELRKVAEGFVSSKVNTEFVLEGFCGCDLSQIDMSNLSIENFKRLTYDSRTKFSQEQLEKFQPFDIIMEKGKKFANIEKSDTNEANGKGTTIGIIDKFSNISDKQFEGRTITVYKVSKDGVQKLQPNDAGVFLEKEENGFHGNTAFSLAAGKECGVAPNANVILYAIDGITYEEAQKAVLDFAVENKENEEFTLPDIISISADTGIEKYKTELDELEKIGCSFINSKKSREHFTWGRMNDDNEVVLDEFIEDILKMPSNENSKQEEVKKLLGSATKIPVTGRTSSYIDDDGNEVYRYNGSLCGNSFAIAQIAGLFLLAKQANKSITFDDFATVIKEQKKFNVSEIINNIRNLEGQELKGESSERIITPRQIAEVGINYNIDTENIEQVEALIESLSVEKENQKTR